jgi:hypothetical protein
MALLWFDGFDKYGDASGTCDPERIMETRYAVSKADNLYPKTGRFGDYAIAPVYDSNTWFQTPHLTTDRTLIVGFSIRAAANYPQGYFMNLLSPNNWSLSLYIHSDGSISIRRNTTILEQTGAGVLPPEEWRFIQLKIYCDATNGTWELRIDNTVELQGTGNTQSDSDNYYSAVRFASVHHLHTYQPWFDDLWICDSTGAVANDFLGPGYKVSTLSPSDDGDSSDWSPNPWPDHVDNLDELVQDDTEYVESSTTNHLDLYDYDSPPAMSAIQGVQVQTEAIITEPNPYTLKTVIKHDGTEDEDSGQLVGSSDYLVAYPRLMLVNPVTATTWIRQDIEYLQAGVKVG